MNTLISILDWIKGPGLRPIIILMVGIAAYFLFKNTASGAMKALIMRQEKRRGRTKKEQELKTKTLSRVASSLVSLVIVVIFIFMLLQSLGINISALLAGAGVMGLAIGFGAQSLIKDYLNGFFILAEDQFVMGDVIKVGDKAGKVEDFNLRRTVLRDNQGIVHIIPNSQIKIVSNLTREWSKAILILPVSYETDIDKAISVIEKVGKDLAQDEEFKKYIIKPLSVAGVDKWAESSINIKATCTTTPIKQWGIRRELLKRIKQAFEKEGIEIPYPRRVIIQKREKE